MASAQSPHSNLACSKTVCVVFSCLSGGYALCSGGVSLADAERLNDEPLARPLARVEHFADQTQLGEWRRKQTDAAIAAVGGLIREFVQWVIGQALASRWTYAGRAEVF